MHVVERGDLIEVELDGRVILRHAPDAPCLYLGVGDPRLEMHRGHFEIEDYIVERLALRSATVSRAGEETSVAFAPGTGQPALLTMPLTGRGAPATLAFRSHDPALNRFWLRLVAEPDEHLWGGGEQLSYFDLRGRRFPLWTSEPGNGRDPSTLLTWKASQAHSGGAYHNTYYPQPTYLSSRRYALHLDTTAYSAFDFRQADYHEVEVWAIPARIELWARDSFAEIVQALSARFGRQPPLPDWVLQGAVVGLKDGARSFDRLQGFLDAGAAISGLWCEDWVGVRETSFGKRLFWDWRWNPDRYPGLDRRIGELREQGVRFLGDLNPYLCVDGSLYPVAERAGYLIRRPDADAPYIVDFGEFEGGLMDFTNPDACAWFEEEVIGRNMLDFGLSGWMADFGEYLPIDVRLANGEPGATMHNAWPVLWGQVNANAVARRGKTGEALFFMRSGYSGVQRYCPLLWAGDQSVDFSRHDGIGTVICAALSSGLLGNAFHHSDIGGYTSLYGNVRTPELLMRWSEMAAFTSVMRSHEGNRPAQNLQLDQDPKVLAHFARMTRVYRRLSGYLARLSEEASRTGLPVQRPLFLHFEQDRRTYAIQTQYLYGRDLLVAPVIQAGVERWRAYLPGDGEWVHVWSGERFRGGAEAEVPAPFGQPPVFYLADSPDAALFASLREVA